MDGAAEPTGDLISTAGPVWNCWPHDLSVIWNFSSWPQFRDDIPRLLRLNHGRAVPPGSESTGLSEEARRFRTLLGNLGKGKLDDRSQAGITSPLCRRKGVGGIRFELRESHTGITAEPDRAQGRAPARTGHPSGKPDGNRHPTSATRPVGMANTGNTCYRNAVLQIMARIHDLGAAIHGNDVASQFAKIYGRLWDAANAGASASLATEPLIAALRSALGKMQMFAKGDQHDASELFQKLLEALGCCDPGPDEGGKSIIHTTHTIPRATAGSDHPFTSCEAVHRVSIPRMMRANHSVSCRCEEGARGVDRTREISGSLCKSTGRA